MCLLQKLKGMKMLSALETWINDKLYVGMVAIHKADRKVAGYCSENNKSFKSKSTYNVKFARYYKNTDQGKNQVPYCKLKVLGYIVRAKAG